MKILIIDDSISKVQNIVNVLLSFVEITSDDIVKAESVRDAKIQLRDLKFDLVILDLHLPIHYGEEPKPLAGLELLREIHERSLYIKPHCIVGLTEFEEAANAGLPYFTERLWSIVTYSVASTDWEQRLKAKVTYLLEFKQCESVRNDHGVDCVVITALNFPEFSQVTKRGTWEILPVSNDPTRYWISTDQISKSKVRIVAAHAPQMGMPATSVLATKAIIHFKPKLIVMTGISAGIPGKARVGDLVVSDPCWDWGNGKQIRNEDGTVFEPDPVQERVSPMIRSIIEDAKRDTMLFPTLMSVYSGNKPDYIPELHIGPCASGSCVISDQILRDSVKEHSRKLIGLDMEAYGLMHAANNSLLPPTQAFSVKAVCDYADPEKSDGFQDFGSYLSYAFLIDILAKYFFDSDFARK